MDDVTLLNVQKRQLFDLIQANKVDPLQFEWATARKGDVFVRTISLLRSMIRPKFAFTFDFRDGFYHPECTPWTDAPQRVFDAMIWEDCVRKAAAWARVARDEVNTVDPWKALPGAAFVSEISVGPDTANTQFSYSETERIAQGLNEIRSLLEKNGKSSKQQLKQIGMQIASLLESSKTMGRKDWVNQAIGSLITLSISLALPPEVTRQVFSILKATLTGLVQLMPHIIASAPALS